MPEQPDAPQKPPRPDGFPTDDHVERAPRALRRRSGLSSLLALLVVGLAFGTAAVLAPDEDVHSSGSIGNVKVQGKYRGTDCASLRVRVSGVARGAPRD